MNNPKNLPMQMKRFIVLTVRFHKEEDGRWTAECQELGTATYSNSLENAQKEIEEAILLHLNTLQDVGGIKRFFEERGIKILSQPPKKKAPISIEAPNDPGIFSQPSVHELCMA